jgi:cell division protein ZapA (FtsZ GTPase activity inhibitor)
MLPAIFISSLCTLLSVVLKDFNFGPILVSSLMAINSFILAMISYLKLDAKAEAHKITAYKFEKLQSLCELRSGRTLFMKNENGEKNLVEFINKLDEQVREIKESNQFILPERIRYHYPILYSTNVFSDIKKIYNEEMVQRTRLKNLINRIKDDPANYKLQTDRDRLLEQIIKCRDKYLQIDDLFDREITKQITESRNQFSCCNWLKT